MNDTMKRARACAALDIAESRAFREAAIGCDTRALDKPSHLQMLARSVARDNHAGKLAPAWEHIGSIRSWTPPDLIARMRRYQSTIFEMSATVAHLEGERYRERASEDSDLEPAS